MDYLFTLDDSCSEAVFIRYNHFIIIIGSNIMEALNIIILNLIAVMQLYRGHVWLWQQ